MPETLTAKPHPEIDQIPDYDAEIDVNPELAAEQREMGNVAVEQVVEGVDLTEHLRLPEALEQRVEHAYEQSSFKLGPEVKEAIQGYYQDHYGLGAVLERVVRNDIEGLTSETVEASIENHFLKSSAIDVLQNASDPSKRGEALRRAEQLIYGKLFRENAVATETLDDPESEYLQSLATQLRDQAVAEGLAHRVQGFDSPDWYIWDSQKAGVFTPNNTTELRDPDRIAPVHDQFTDKAFWEDTRFAGQLEFHNTGSLLEVHKNGATLRSRTRQRELTGSFRSQMGASNNRSFGMHSNLPHFSEMYSHHEYKQDMFGGEESQPGTFAVPLAKLIETAPYARDSKYGIVEFKDVASEANVVINDKVGVIGSGGTDTPGKIGNDRVFMADYRADHAADAINYDLVLGDESIRVLTEEEKHVAHKGIGFGVGKDMPGEHIVPFSYTEFVYPSDDLTLEQKQAVQTEMTQKMADSIQKLQTESRNRPEYKNKIVVPLRNGVMEFEAEAQNGRYEYQKVVAHSPVEQAA